MRRLSVLAALLLVALAAATSAAANSPRFGCHAGIELRQFVAVRIPDCRRRLGRSDDHDILRCRRRTDPLRRAEQSRVHLGRPDRPRRLERPELELDRRSPRGDADDHGDSFAGRRPWCGRPSERRRPACLADWRPWSASGRAVRERRPGLDSSAWRMGLRLCIHRGVDADETAGAEVAELRRCPARRSPSGGGEGAPGGRAFGLA